MVSSMPSAITSSPGRGQMRDRRADVIGNDDAGTEYVQLAGHVYSRQQMPLAA